MLPSASVASTVKLFKPGELVSSAAPLTTSLVHVKAFSHVNCARSVLPSS